MVKFKRNISKLKNYCKAEEYHQKYIEKNRYESISFYRMVDKNIEKVKILDASWHLPKC
jgi:peptide methionine sulfoxide reductase MsrA